MCRAQLSLVFFKIQFSYEEKKYNLDCSNAFSMENKLGFINYSRLRQVMNRYVTGSNNLLVLITQ